MNATYLKYRQALLGGNVDMVDDTIRAQLIDTSAYAFSAAHEFLSSVPAGARIGPAVTLTAKTIVDGVFDAANIVVPNVPAGAGGASAVEALVLYREGADAASSLLIAYVDETEDDSLPVTPNGGNINVNWPANGILAIL